MCYVLTLFFIIHSLFFILFRLFGAGSESQQLLCGADCRQGPSAYERHEMDIADGIHQGDKITLRAGSMATTPHRHKRAHRVEHTAHHRTAHITSTAFCLDSSTQCNISIAERNNPYRHPPAHPLYTPALSSASLCTHTHTHTHTHATQDLGRRGLVRAEEKEQGWYISYIDRTPGAEVSPSLVGFLSLQFLFFFFPLLFSASMR